MAQACLSAEEVAEATAEERCNGCRRPRRYWGPVCGSVTWYAWIIFAAFLVLTIGAGLAFLFGDR